ncbi:DHH family phosphoesterase [Aerococcaceae bacterium NML130460]|nr:DHH family phosphoesterase [Aerococcaceae bacterium NML130460]
MNIQEKIKQFIKVCQKLTLNWQIYCIILFYVLIMIATIFIKWQIALLLFIFLVVVFVFLVINIDTFIRDTQATVRKLSRATKNAQEDSLYRSPIAVLLYDEIGVVKWINPAFQQVYGNEDILGRKLSDIGGKLHQALNEETDSQWQVIQIQDKFYKLMHQIELKSIYLMDITEEMHIREMKKFDRLVFGYLHLDDYDELLQTLDDSQEAQIDARIMRDINNWAKLHKIYLKRLDDENFILIMNQKILDALEEAKFIEIERITERNFANNVPISVSIGISYTNENEYDIDSLAKQAQLNLDLALGRGGDQVVVRAKDDKARFYGGKLSPQEKRTTSRSKLVYQALLNSVEQASNIFIAGHRYPDLDAISSAIAVHKIVSQLKKDAKIIVNQSEFNPDVAQLLATPQFKNEWKQMFTDIETAKAQLNEQTLIIMVDHHRPSLSEAEPIITDHDVVIIDHHRRSEEFPNQSVLTFIEPYASSTAELITEFFIYTRNTHQALSKIEATALLAGIIVDTNNFGMRTGARTFDAASYLKSRGADTVLIQRLLKEDLSVVQKRHRLIERTEYFKDNIVITKASNEELCDNVVAAQTADMMLTLKDVEAAFAIYRRDEETIGISARSLGTINVQTIMEKLGGGGHLSNAATQLKDMSIDSAYEALIQVIEQN